MSTERVARDILVHNFFMCLATSDTTAQPWNTPLAFSFDRDLYLYWRSAHTSQHSLNIAQNSQVFIAIYDSRRPTPGLYIQATASLVDDKAEIEHALKVDRHPKFKDESGAFLGDNPRRYYKVIPQAAWVNADAQQSGKFVDIRQPVSLDGLRTLLANEVQL
jgi:hypothetical protein